LLTSGLCFPGASRNCWPPGCLKFQDHVICSLVTQKGTSATPASPLFLVQMCNSSSSSFPSQPQPTPKQTSSILHPLPRACLPNVHRALHPTSTAALYCHFFESRFAKQSLIPSRQTRYSASISESASLPIHRISDRGRLRSRSLLLPRATDPNGSIRNQLFTSAYTIKMSARLDKSLDEIISTQRRSSGRGRGRRVHRTAPAATAPAGGVKKNPKHAKGAVKNIPTGPSGSSGEGKILVTGFVSLNAALLE